MPNLRIVSDNATKRATIVASTQAGSLTADRLKLPSKSKVWRSTGTTATLTLTFNTAETVDCVALPFCNFTSTSQIRVQGYTNAADSVALFDTGTKLACPYIPFNQLDWGTQPLGVNAFAYSVASQAVCWFVPKQVKKLVITLTDTANPSGYLEGSCLVTGASWSTLVNMGYGAGVMIKETTKNERTESGNLRSDRGTLARSLSFDLKNLKSADRLKVWNFLVRNGLSNPAFVSLYPESADSAEEQMHQIYGKLSAQAKLSLQSFGISQATLELEEV